MKLDNDKIDEKEVKDSRDPKIIISTQNLIPHNRPVEKQDINNFLKKNYGFDNNKKTDKEKGNV